MKKFDCRWKYCDHYPKIGTSTTLFYNEYNTFAWRMRIGIWMSTMCWSDTNPTSFFVSVPEKNHLNQGILRHSAVMGCFVTSSWMLLNGDSRTSLKWNDMVWIQGQQTASKSRYHQIHSIYLIPCWKPSVISVYTACLSTHLRHRLCRYCRS